MRTARPAPRTRCALDRRSVRHGGAGDLEVGALRTASEMLEALGAGQDKGAVAQRAGGDASVGRLLLVLEYGGERGAGLADAERLDLELALRRLPARAAPCAGLMSGKPGRHSDLRAGGT